MLDEPTAGVSPIVMDELFDHIIKVKRTKVAILMVEQNAKQALNISDRGYVLVTGENKYSGTGKEILNDPRESSTFLCGYYGFFKRNNSIIKLHFCASTYIWFTISARCYICNFNLWNSKVC
jgi:energy-coupling factor transporter ATP-binding protein EcfA2